MKKIINQSFSYTNDMLRGIYAAHEDQLIYINDDPRCLCIKESTPGKVAIITGGGTGHLPLFLGYVGKGLLDGCAVGDVFQSPSAEQIYELSKHLDQGAGVLYLYGNYTGDIMNFDMAAELCEMDGIKTETLIGNDDICSAEKENISVRRGVAGIFFLYKCIGAAAAMGKSLSELKTLGKKVGSRIGTVGFALSPCIIPEIGQPGFVLEEGQLAMGMGIHGEPGIWTGTIKSAREIAEEIMEMILKDMAIPSGESVSVMINGLGATPLDELYIIYGEVKRIMDENGIRVMMPHIGEYATSMEMAGASVSVFHLDEELEELLRYPASSPFFML